MVYFLGGISFLILLFLSGIHLYWAVGGKWGIQSVLPTTPEEKIVLQPRWVDSVVVGVVLAIMGILFAVKSGLFELHFLPNWLLAYGLYVVSGIFLLRAMGDFKYVGFFKQIKTTKFGKNDTKYYSPLCLFLGIVGILIEVI